MQDKPTAQTLLRALIGFMEDAITPQLSGHAGFQARVARNLLAILEREARLGDRFAHAQQARLKALLKQDGPLHALNQELCQRIRDGKLSYRDAALRTHLRKATMGKLAIDQPRYARYRQAQTDGWEEEDGWEAPT